MTYSRSLRQCRQFWAKAAAISAVTLLVASASAAQATRPAPPPPNARWLQDLNKNPILQAELGKLVVRLQHELQSPPARSQSRLLPLLPSSTTVYAAFPNYGDLARQALTIFHQELQQDPALRNWWQQGDMAAVGAKIEDTLEKFSQLSEYLGDEIVLSTAMDVAHPKLFVLAEVRKPGLKPFLQQILAGVPGKSNAPVRVFEPQELATAAGDSRSSEAFAILVRPDFVIAARDVASLRNFNAALDRSNRDFASTPFCQRVAEAYKGGVTGVAAADLHSILGRFPRATEQKQLTLQRSGFADVKFLVWRHNNVAGRAISEGELSFTGPRRGAASWLAAPAPMGSLDFVSPNAVMATSLLLVSPAKIFDDVVEIARASNANWFAALPQFEQALNVNLKQDLLGQLTGEVTVEMDDVTPSKPTWKVILGVKDPARLQQTASKLLAVAGMVPEQYKERDFTYYRLRVSSPKTPVEFDYAFAGGYLVVGSTYGALTDAITSHVKGESLGKSAKLLASLPPGRSSGVSALFYEDPSAMAALQMRQVAPQMAGSLAQLTSVIKPQVVCLYGDESAIREASTSAGFDASAVLVAAAVAIPNLLRSRIAANEASAVATLRTAVTAEVTYAAAYPERGYAPDLASLGPNPRGTASYTLDHGGIIDASLGNPSCTSGAWCTKSGFRFSLAAGCRGKLCTDFVIVGTPISANTGERSFCSTSDGVIRSKTGPPVIAPVSISECRAWSPMH